MCQPDKHEKNRDKHLAWMRAYQKTDACRRSTKLSYQRRGDEIRARNRAAWAVKKNQYSVVKKRWRAANHQKCLALMRNRRARLKGNGGTHTAADIAQILSLQKHKCACCRGGLRRKRWHVDHIVPIARGGSNDRRNLQLLCQPCNHSKHSRDPLEFMRSTMGMLL